MFMTMMGIKNFSILLLWALNPNHPEAGSQITLTHHTHTYTLWSKSSATSQVHMPVLSPVCYSWHLNPRMSPPKKTTKFPSTRSIARVLLQMSALDSSKRRGLEEPSVLLPRGAFKQPPEVEGRIFKLVTQDHGSPKNPLGGVFFHCPLRWKEVDFFWAMSFNQGKLQGFCFGSKFVKPNFEVHWQILKALL